MASPHFRAGVVIVVRGADQRVLAFERADIPGQWQFPQGGLLANEPPIAAAWRELHEETGLGSEHVVMVREHPDWVVYEYPPGLRERKGRLGQAQRWYLFEPIRSDIVPTPDGSEFTAWKWVSCEWMIENAVEFRRAGYEQVLSSL